MAIALQVLHKPTGRTGHIFWVTEIIPKILYKVRFRGGIGYYMISIKGSELEPLKKQLKLFLNNESYL